MAQKFYMEFNFTVSDKIIKLKSVNFVYYCHDMGFVKLKFTNFYLNDLEANGKTLLL